MINSMAGKRIEKEIEVVKIVSQEDLKTAQQIRYDVFVIGQNVPVEEEM